MTKWSSWVFHFFKLFVPLSSREPGLLKPSSQKIVPWYHSSLTTTLRATVDQTPKSTLSKWRERMEKTKSKPPATVLLLHFHSHKVDYMFFSPWCFGSWQSQWLSKWHYAARVFLHKPCSLQELKLGIWDSTATSKVQLPITDGW